MNGDCHYQEGVVYPHVSVPLRGKDSHEHVIHGLSAEGESHVSVPLRGKDSHERANIAQYGISVWNVSVPLRGKDSHERGGGFNTPVGKIGVSVPLRGKDSHELKDAEAARRNLSTFPSPCGEKIVMNTK